MEADIASGSGAFTQGPALETCLVVGILQDTFLKAHEFWLSSRKSEEYEGNKTRYVKTFLLQSVLLFS